MKKRSKVYDFYFGFFKYQKATKQQDNTRKSVQYSTEWNLMCRLSLTHKSISLRNQWKYIQCHNRISFEWWMCDGVCVCLTMPSHHSVVWIEIKKWSAINWSRCFQLNVIISCWFVSGESSRMQSNASSIALRCSMLNN